MASPVSSCSTEFDAAEVFAEALMNQINREDVRNMVQTQREMLSRFEKTNEMLINFNILSANRFAATSQEFKKHTQLLYEMKRDLDCVFKRIRVVKDRLGKVYPDAFKACGNVTPLLEEEEGEEESFSSSQSNQSVAENKSNSVTQSVTNNEQTTSVNNSTSEKPQTDKQEKQSPSSSIGPAKTSGPDSGKENKSQKTNLQETKSKYSDSSS